MSPDPSRAFRGLGVGSAFAEAARRSRKVRAGLCSLHRRWMAIVWMVGSVVDCPRSAGYGMLPSQISVSERDEEGPCSMYERLRARTGGSGLP